MLTVQEYFRTKRAAADYALSKFGQFERIEVEKNQPSDGLYREGFHWVVLVEPKR